MAMIESGPATPGATDSERSTSQTAIPASAASATLVAMSQGLRPSQRRFSRAPASNSSSASAPSTASRNAGSSPTAPRPASASAVPTSV